MKTITVTTRFSGGGYAARAGRGKKAKAATCTSSPQEAARRAAAKFFHLDACNVQTPADIALVETGCQVHPPFARTYTATLPDLPAAKGGA